jgi:hypothetical protein
MGQMDGWNVDITQPRNEALHSANQGIDGASDQPNSLPRGAHRTREDPSQVAGSAAHAANQG